MNAQMVCAVLFCSGGKFRKALQHQWWAHKERGGNSAQGKNPQLRASRRERCIAYVQQDYRYKPKQGAKPALERCMHGEPIPANFNEREGF
jgi:hypothetical protein